MPPRAMFSTTASSFIPAMDLALDRFLVSGGKGHVDGNKVGDLQYLVDGHTFGVLLLKNLGGEVGVVGHDLHPEGKGADVRENSLEDAFALAMWKS